MGNFFSVDGPLYKFMSRLMDILVLNILVLLCSIPIVTMGAAITAAFNITLKMVDDEEGYMAKPFFKAFKENLKQGSLMGLFNLVAVYALYLDFQLGQKVGMVFMVIFFIGLLLCITHFLFAYALLARYDNSIINTMRNSHRISIRYFKKSIFLVILIWVEIVFFYQISWIFFTIGVLIGPACIIYTISSVAKDIFKIIERDNELKEEERKGNLETGGKEKEK